MIDVYAINKKKKKKKKEQRKYIDSYVHSVKQKTKKKTKTKQNKDSINQSPQLFISSDSYSLYRIYSPIIPNKTTYSYHA